MFDANRDGFRLLFLQYWTDLLLHTTGSGGVVDATETAGVGDLVQYGYRTNGLLLRLI